MKRLGCGCILRFTFGGRCQKIKCSMHVEMERAARNPNAPVGCGSMDTLRGVYDHDPDKRETD